MEPRSDRRPVNALSSYAAFQEKRRFIALQRQAQEKQQRIAAKRQLLRLAAVEEDAVSDTGMSECSGLAANESAPAVLATEAAASDDASPSTSGRKQQHVRFQAQHMQQPEWMTDVPTDLATNWLVCPRPEGQRCLLVASRGKTTSRLRDGQVLHRFASWLPDGSAATRCGGGFSVVEAVHHAANATYYVTDVLAWRGVVLLDCTAEMRMWWLATKGTEEAEGVAAALQDEAQRLAVLSPTPCTSESLRDAGRGVHGFNQDGLCLLHKEGAYALGQTTPLVLLWKDALCSPFMLDTDATGVAQPQQVVTLQYRMDCTVATSDEPPVVLGRMPATFAQGMGRSLRAGKLLRFKIGDAGILFHEGRPTGADLQYTGPAGQRRVLADTFSKIMFQAAARMGHPLDFDVLLAAVAAQPAQMVTT